MRTRRPARSPLYVKIQFAFTDHSITVWAGGHSAPAVLRTDRTACNTRPGTVPLPEALAESDSSPGRARAGQPHLSLSPTPTCRLYLVSIIDTVSREGILVVSLTLVLEVP